MGHLQTMYRIIFASIALVLSGCIPGKGKSGCDYVREGKASSPNGKRVLVAFFETCSDGAFVTTADQYIYVTNPDDTQIPPRSGRLVMSIHKPDNEPPRLGWSDSEKPEIGVRASWEIDLAPEFRQPNSITLIVNDYQRFAEPPNRDVRLTRKSLS